MRSLRSGSSMLAAIAAATLLTACDDLATSPARSPQVSLSFTSPASGDAGTGGSPTAAQVTDGAGRRIELDRVQLLIAEVELKRLLHDECAEEDDACEKFQSGPSLVDLPLDGGVVTPFTSPITPDTYEELELEIDQPEDDDGSRARFAAEHPDWPRKATVRVTGRYDAGTGGGAQPFDVFLEIEAEIEREFATPLVVDATTDPTSINVTVQVDLADWFRRAGGELIDPRTLATDANLMDIVEENVERSFAAFEDHDGDGHEDSDDDDRSGRDHDEDD
jgi:hypothetical protein